ncbi:hypothetical protein [Saccharopolyspora erythraea]|uniref:hypothetical protein n=1 Tax=Saccharopolyspora erythraea TaxID=1836 RepID=UPI002011E5D1|nr:hypothetical protein [Saccharopolyspora erythraea]
MLELAARRVPGARLVRGDMRTLDAGLGDFDAVRAYSPRALGEVVSGAGFVVEELREVEVVCESDRPSRWSRRCSSARGRPGEGRSAQLFEAGFLGGVVVVEVR